MDDDVGRSLISMMESDQRTLAQLVERGEIGPHQPYHPTLREIHEANAKALRKIIDEMGWPGIPQVGESAAEAAWLIAQHAVFDTDFMSYCADLLEDAVSKHNVEGWQLAFLRDRLCTTSGKEQIYGTQFDQDDDGWPIPFPIQDPDRVDERRRKIGLNSLAERISEMRDREEARRKAVERADRRKDT